MPRVARKKKEKKTWLNQLYFLILTTLAVAVGIWHRSIILGALYHCDNINFIIIITSTNNVFYFSPKYGRSEAGRCARMRVSWWGSADQKLKLICFYFIQLQLSINILLWKHNLNVLNNGSSGVNGLTLWPMIEVVKRVRSHRPKRKIKRKR